MEWDTWEASILTSTFSPSGNFQGFPFGWKGGAFLTKVEGAASLVAGQSSKAPPLKTAGDLESARTREERSRAPPKTEGRIKVPKQFSRKRFNNFTDLPFQF